ncbi:hypothetical protein [Lysinibacillus sp. NPDC056232]
MKQVVRTKTFVADALLSLHKTFVADALLSLPKHLLKEVKNDIAVI